MVLIRGICVFGLLPLALLDDGAAKDRNTSRTIQDFYADVVYPARNDYLVQNLFRKTGPERALEFSHFIGGRSHGEQPGSIDLCQTFRTFVPGCGTGNQIVSLLAAAEALACDKAKYPDWPSWEVVCADLSPTSLKIAETKIKESGLLKFARRVDFTLLDLTDESQVNPEKLGGYFDYATATGVLHHLADPLVGVQAMRRVVRPHGAIELLLYGQLGRSGLYDMQAAMRKLLAPGRAKGQRTQRQEIALTKRVFDALPAVHPLKTNKRLMEGWAMKKAEGFADLFLNPQDRAYYINEVFDLAAQAGIQITRLSKLSQYLPDLGMTEMQDLVAGMTFIDRAVVGERVHAEHGDHTIWATVPSPETQDLQPFPKRLFWPWGTRDPGDLDMALVPVFRNNNSANVADALEKSRVNVSYPLFKRQALDEGGDSLFENRDSALGALFATGPDSVGICAASFARQVDGCRSFAWISALLANWAGKSRTPTRPADRACAKGLVKSGERDGGAILAAAGPLIRFLVMETETQLLLTSISSHAHYCADGGLTRSALTTPGGGATWWKVGEDIAGFNPDRLPPHAHHGEKSQRQAEGRDPSTYSLEEATDVYQQAQDAFKIQDLRGSIPLFEEAIKADKLRGHHQMAMHDNFGQALAQTGRGREAEGHFRKAVDLAPPNELPRVKKNLCYYLGTVGRGHEDGCGGKRKTEL